MAMEMAMAMAMVQTDGLLRCKLGLQRAAREDGSRQSVAALFIVAECKGTAWHERHGVRDNAVRSDA
jgi:hypothetical protein